MALISEDQWLAVVLDSWGLRSGSSANDLDGPSYSMDCLVEDPRQGIPSNWDDLLGGTIDLILQFPDYQARYLMLVTPSVGLSDEYPGAFPKSNAFPTSAPESLLIGQNSKQQLIDWVVGVIPSIDAEENNDEFDGH